MAVRGRPPSENPKDTFIKLRMDTTAVQQLDECCTMLNSTRSQVIRAGIEKMRKEAEKRAPKK